MASSILNPSIYGQGTKKLEDLAAERAVLSALCQYGLDVYLEIDFVDSLHFTDAMNQLIFDCIYKSISENTEVELSTILSAANDLQEQLTKEVPEALKPQKIKIMNNP